MLCCVRVKCFISRNADILCDATQPKRKEHQLDVVESNEADGDANLRLQMYDAVQSLLKPLRQLTKDVAKIQVRLKNLTLVKRYTAFCAHTHTHTRSQ
jgi:hypothetical protein